MSNLSKLSREDYSKAKSIFSAAIQLDATEIESFVLSQCADNKGLQSAVSALITMHFDSNGLTLNQQELLSSLANTSRIEPGSQVGKFKIDTHIGSGGMGDVYLASRHDQEVYQKVAIKILRNKLSQSASERFQTERRILAHLEHPGIARLIDAGSHNGETYYAMEYVSGVPIDEYCDKQELTLKQRLVLFLKVCEVVDYAHRSLIIHSDLKPSNILVTEAGDIKLVDFGIAKTLQKLPGFDDLPQDKVAKPALTPQFAAPEQVNDDAITVSCDIYLLGLLLYKLITGRHAFELTDQSWIEVKRTINQEQPGLPSGVEQVSEASQHITWLHKLKGDLDAIVMHALQKKTEDRYTSVSELAADVAHHLSNEPIKIKYDQRLYRYRKQLRKHWLPVSALTLVFAVMLISSLWIWRQSDAIKEERDKALIEKQAAESFSSILVQSFKNADPTKVLKNDLKASQVLLETARLLKAENLADNPVKFKIIHPVMQVFNNISEYQETIEIFDSIAADEFGTLPVEMQSKLIAEKASAINLLGHTQDALDFMNQYTDAELQQHHEFLLAKSMLHDHNGEYVIADQGYTELMNNMDDTEVKYFEICALSGMVKRVNTQYEEGQQLLEGCIAKIEALNDPKYDWNKYELLRVLGFKAYHVREFVEAKQLIEQVIDFRQGVFGEEHISVTPLYSLLSSIVYEMGDVDAATRYSQMSLAGQEKHFGANSPKLAVPYFNLGIQFDSREMYDDAEKMILKAIKLLEDVDENAPNLGFFYTGLGVMYSNAEQYEKARDALLKGKSIELLKFKETGYRVSRINVMLAHVYNELGVYDEAKKLIIRSYDKFMTRIPKDYPGHDDYVALYESLVNRD